MKTIDIFQNLSKFFVLFLLFFRIFDISIDKTAKNDMIIFEKKTLGESIP